MKKLIVMLVLCLLLGVVGCSEPFTSGVVSGVVVTKAWSDKVQADGVASIKAVEAEKVKLDALYEDMVALGKETILIHPETIEAINSLKGREKDPVTWIALASVLANAFGAGKIVSNKKKGT